VSELSQAERTALEDAVRALREALVTAIALLDADMFDRAGIEPLRVLAASPGEPERQSAWWGGG
jgi:hypothetical protein